MTLSQSNINNAQTLAETAFYMSSSDYKDRFLAEKRQLEIRIDKLATFISRIKNSPAGEVPHDCPLELLEEQLATMSHYRDLLIQRCHYEGLKDAIPAPTVAD